MSVYLDASVVVPIFVQETTTPRMEHWLATADDLRLSSWTAAEVSSALSHRQRTERMTGAERDLAETGFDRWLADGPPLIRIDDDDIIAARTLLRYDETLRTPDALHLALAARHGAVLATYDRRLMESALALGLEVVAP